MLTLGRAAVSFQKPSGALRAGRPVEVVVDVSLPGPWIEQPSLGKALRTIDGQAAGRALCFETDGPREVEAPLAGSVTVGDTRIDVHTPAGFPDAGAGRGVEAVLRAEGGLELRYGHLARGSARSGRVRPGDTIGVSGNTGRCIDGCGRHFVAVELGGTARLEELTEPWELELLVDGKSALGATRLPPGEVALRGLKLGRITPSRTPGKRKATLEARLVRGRPGGRAQSSTTLELDLEL